jgi:hypothetical protein
MRKAKAVDWLGSTAWKVEVINAAPKAALYNQLVKLKKTSTRD